MKLEIDPDIRTAFTPSAEFYRSPRFYQSGLDRIFAKSWQLVGSEDLVPEPGQVHPFTFLEGSVEEPLLLARDDQNQIRCLSNVCTHRGALVVEQPEKLSQMRCRYHGRRFHLNGKMAHMPEFEETCDFPAPSDDLRELPLRKWGPFLFVALEPQLPFEDWIGAMSRRIPDSTRSSITGPIRLRSFPVRACKRQPPEMANTHWSWLSLRPTTAETSGGITSGCSRIPCSTSIRGASPSTWCGHFPWIKPGSPISPTSGTRHGSARGPAAIWIRWSRRISQSSARCRGGSARESMIEGATLQPANREFTTFIACWRSFWERKRSPDRERARNRGRQAAARNEVKGPLSPSPDYA